MERRDAKKAWLEEARHGEGVKERRGVEIGGGLHEGGLAEGRRGGGGRRRHVAMYGSILSSMKATDQRIKFREEQVTHKGLADPSD